MNPCTFTTEYPELESPKADIALENELKQQIPDYAIDQMAKFFLSRMQADYAEKEKPSD